LPLELKADHVGLISTVQIRRIWSMCYWRYHERITHENYISFPFRIFTKQESKHPNNSLSSSCC